MRRPAHAILKRRAPTLPSHTRTVPARCDVSLLLDPLTGFRTHRQLLCDLKDALAPASSPSTLAIFDLTGLDTLLEPHGRLAAEQVLVGVSASLAEKLGEATFYRPRYNEFVVIVADTAPHAVPLLSSAVAAVNAEFADDEIALTFGATELPAEAASPIDALILADMRLLLHAHARQARERRSPLGSAVTPASSLPRVGSSRYARA